MHKITAPLCGALPLAVVFSATPRCLPRHTARVLPFCVRKRHHALLCSLDIHIASISAPNWPQRYFRRCHLTSGQRRICCWTFSNESCSSLCMQVGVFRNGIFCVVPANSSHQSMLVGASLGPFFVECLGFPLNRGVCSPAPAPDVASKRVSSALTTLGEDRCSSKLLFEATGPPGPLAMFM